MYTNLNFHPQKHAIPQHVVIIPDGGRRWARKNGISNKESYLVSVKKMIDIMEAYYQYGIKYISFYTASSQNFFRTEEEIQSFYEAVYLGIRNEIGPFAMRNHIDLKIVGRKDERYKMPAVNIEEPSPEKKLFICFNYNSLDEIELAVEKRNNHKESFVNYLDIPYPADILIRTGGAQTLSGFMLPQIAFARLFFLDKLFNDLTVKETLDLIKMYQKYELKYGE